MATARARPSSVSRKKPPAPRRVRPARPSPVARDPGHGFDFAAFAVRLEAAVRKAFTELARAHRGQGLCAFALYGDSGAMTVCPSTNTRAHLDERCADDPDAAGDATFSPAEWALEAEGADDAFAALCARLRAHVATLADRRAAFVAFRRDLGETCLATLERLRAARFFERTAKGPVLLVFQASSDDFDPRAARAMIARLNDADTVRRHRRWLAGG